MVNSPSQPFRTKHLIWFRDRAKKVTNKRKIWLKTQSRSESSLEKV